MRNVLIFLAGWFSVPVLAIAGALLTRLIAGPGCGFECYSEDQTWTTTNAFIIAGIVVALWIVASAILLVVWMVREFMK